MAVTLKKGSKVSLTKEASNLGIRLNNVAVGLGWDISRGTSTYDLDAWALAITDEGLKKKNLVYFGNTLDSSKNIHHCGDNLTGDGDGDDETITIALENLPNTYKHVLVGVTIYRGAQKRQCFSDVDNTFIRVYDRNTGIEICKYSDEFKGDIGSYTSMLFGAFSRVPGGWEFNAVGRGSKFSSIPDALNVYGDYTLEDNINNNVNGGTKHMAVSLSKGGKVSLAKVAADAGISGGLTKIIVGLGWDTNRYDGGAQFDLDAAAFMLGANGKVRNDSDFIFYNNKMGQGVEHTGDNRTGEGDGDDEQIKVDLTAVPADVEKIDFTVTIDQADVRNQNFGMVENSFIRIVDEATGTELVRYDLGEDFSVETAIVVAELYRHNGEWKFNAIGSGFSGGLAALCGNFGIDVG
ncbi:MAG: TerD family protein [Lachnospiraceae bacterium]|nr:TerD family protein [Lachnospiraceae bacterium]